MKEIIRNVAKAGATMFIVGALLAAVLPTLAVGVGLAADTAAATTLLSHSANSLWMGAFFGAMGAINAAVAPALQFVFGEEKKADTPKKRVILTFKAAPQPAQEQETCGCKHREALNAERSSISEQKVIRL